MRFYQNLSIIYNAFDIVPFNNISSDLIKITHSFFNIFLHIEKLPFFYILTKLTYVYNHIA